MSTDAPNLDAYRAQHNTDVATFGEVLADLRHMLATGLSGLEDIARKLADVVPQVEQGQRNLRLQGASISDYARHHGQAGVDTPDALTAFLASLSDRERAVYDEARLGAPMAARALGRHARP